MPQVLTSPMAREQDQFTISVSTTLDSSQDIPTSLTWTLTDEYGEVINDRSAVAISPAASMTVTLSGDDLQIFNRGEDKEKRFIVFDGLDSEGIPIYESLEFYVEKVGA